MRMKELEEEAISAMREAMGDSCGMFFTGGKDSMVMLHLWREHISPQPDLLVIDTYNQFDSIYDFRDMIETDWKLDFDVRSNEEFLEEVIWNDDDERGFAWDGFKTEGCCGALKIDVMKSFMQDGYTDVIIGRRNEDVDEDLPLSEERRDPHPHQRYHPLANWSDQHIKAYIAKNRIPLPDVYDRGFKHTDCTDCTMKGEEGDDWSGVSQEKKQQLENLRDMGYV